MGESVFSGEREREREREVGERERGRGRGRGRGRRDLLASFVALVLLCFGRYTH